MTTKHKHHDVIVAFAEGKLVQRKTVHDTWIDFKGVNGCAPTFTNGEAWRIKQAKFVYDRFVSSDGGRLYQVGCSVYMHIDPESQNRHNEVTLLAESYLLTLEEVQKTWPTHEWSIED